MPNDDDAIPVELYHRVGDNSLVETSSSRGWGSVFAPKQLSKKNRKATCILRSTIILSNVCEARQLALDRLVGFMVKL